MRIFPGVAIAALVTGVSVAGAALGLAQEFTLTLTGDSIITQRVSVYQQDLKFMAVVNAVREGDARFTNVEVLFQNYDAAPAAQSGGTWLAAEPYLFRDLQWVGFNLFATANNHALDYGIEGLRAQRRLLSDSGAAYAGIGENLGEARAPGYLETSRGRVALLSCASTFLPSAPAGAQRPDLRGRPGLNPLRHRTRYIVDAASLDALRKVMAGLKINLSNPLVPSEPDTPKLVHFLNSTFELGDKPRVVTEADPRDVQALTDSIRNARRLADYVLVSVHAHEAEAGSREVPAQFLTEFAHAAINAGADAVVGHGPHVLRGIEIYKGKPIFYSLANFIFQNDTVKRLPADLYEQHGLGADALPADVYEKRSDNDQRGFAADPVYWESAVARLEFRGGQPSEIRLTPITLGFGRTRWQRGRPERADPEASTRILERLQKLSQPFGTKMDVREGIGTITITNGSNDN